MSSTIISDSTKEFYRQFSYDDSVRKAIFGPETKKRDSKNSYHLHHSGDDTVHVSLERGKEGQWKCFSRDEGGDFLKYIIEKDLLPFTTPGDWLEAVKALWQYARIDWQPPQYKAPEKEKIKPQKPNLVTPEIKEDLNTSLFQALEKSPEAIAYLEKECISLDDAKALGIGLVTEEIAAKYRQLFSGKWTNKETGEEHTGHVGRIAFPVVQGASTFYACRTLDPKEEVKYKNTKDAEKIGFCGETLAKNGNRLILVEGYKDALVLNHKEAKESNGRNKITYLGIGSCNLSEMQIQSLLDLTDKIRPSSIIFSLDSDVGDNYSGYQGTLKALLTLLPLFSWRNQIDLLTTANWEEIKKKQIVKDPLELLKNVGYDRLTDEYACVVSWELFLRNHIYRLRINDEITTRMALRLVVNALMKCQNKDLERFKSIVEINNELFPWETIAFAETLDEENQKHLKEKHLQEVEQHHAKLKHAIECADLDAIAQLKKDYPIEPGIGRLPYDTIEELKQDIINTPYKIPTYLSDKIDQVAGWIPGSMHIILGRPANGKTSMMTWIALQQLQRSDRKVVFFTYEESSASLMKKFIMQAYRDCLTYLDEKSKTKNYGGNKYAVEYYISEHFKGNFQQKDQKLEKAIQEIMGYIETGRLRLVSTVNHHLPANKFCEAVARFKKEESTDLFFADYLQIIPPNPKEKSEANWLKIKNISRAIAECAKEVQVPIILGAQASREVESRSSKVPYASDIREGGDVEQDAYSIFAISKSEMPEGADKDKHLNPYKIGIVKNRGGDMFTLSGIMKTYCLHFDFKDFMDD